MNELARLLSTEGEIDDISCMVSGRPAYEYIKRQEKVDYKDVHSLQKLHEEFIESDVDLDRIEDLEAEFGNPTLQPFILADRYYSQYDHRDQLRLVRQWFDFYLDYFNEFDLDYFLVDAVAACFTFVSFVVASERHEGAIRWKTTRIKDQWGLMIDEPYDEFTMIHDLFCKLQNEEVDRDSVSEARERAVLFLDSFRDEGTRPGYYSEPDRVSTLSYLKSALAAPYRITTGYVTYNYLTPDKYYIPHNFEQERFTTRIGDKVKETYRSQRIERSNLFHSPSLDDEPFAFFPLHLQPEASTLLLAPMYLDQVALAKQISKALPVEYKLYVKEHPSMIGRRALSYYRELKQIPNVRLIHPRYDSHELIKASDLVTTITGTAGLEATFYRTPVVSFGKAMYNVLSTVWQAGDPSELPRVIDDALTNCEHDDEEIINLLTSIFAEGFALPDGQVGPEATDTANRVYEQLEPILFDNST